MFSSVLTLTLPPNINPENATATFREAPPQSWVTWVCKGTYRTVCRLPNTWSLIRHWGFYRDLFAPYCKKNTVAVHYPSLVNDYVIIPFLPAAKALLSHHRNDDLFTQAPRGILNALLEEVFKKQMKNEDIILRCGPEQTKKFRTFLHSHFLKSNIFQNEKVVEGFVLGALKEWEKAETLDLNLEAKKFPLNVVCSLLLDYHDESGELSKAIDLIFSRLGSISFKRIENILERVGLGAKVTWTDQKELEAAYLVINDAIDAVKNNDGEELSLVRAMKDAKTPEGETKFSDAEIEAMIFSFFLGGQDTTANALKYIIIKLGQNREWQVQIAEGTLPVEWVIAEGLRMLPPANFIARLAKTDLDLEITDKDSHESAHFLIPKGSAICAAPAFLARDERTVVGKSCEIDVFNPFRWEGLANQGQLKEALSLLEFMPFGSGPNACPMSRLAALMLQQFIIKMSEGYEWATEFEGEPRQKTGFTTSPAGDLRISLKRRHNELV